MGRTKLVVDRDALEAALSEVEANGPLDTQNEVFKRVAAKLDNPSIKAHTVRNRILEFGLELKTPKGKRGVGLGHGAGGSQKKSRAEKFKHPIYEKNFRLVEQRQVEALGYNVKPHFKKLIGTAKRGSLTAIIKLNCLACSNYQTAEIKHCRVFDCPMWSVRPYQDSPEAQENEN